MSQLKDNVINVVKGWGYEYLLVASGAFLGLLVVVFVGFEIPTATKPVISRPGPAPLSSTPGVKPKPQVEKRAASRTQTRPVASEPALSSKVSISSTDPIVRNPPKDAPRWQRYAAVHGPVLGRPMIAVLIDDMGVDRKRSARAIQLPGPLTMSFLTYARGLRGQAAKARAAGHEIMIHVPMEADDANAYPGPKAIKKSLSKTEIERRVDWALGRLENYVGINNHMGSRFTADRRGMTLVLAEVKRRGLLFIDSRTSPKSVGQRVARRLSVPFAARDIFIDDDPSGDAVTRQLKALERAASEKGYAIAIGHPYKLTVKMLENWLPTLAARGFVLVPVSAIVRHRREAG